MSKSWYLVIFLSVVIFNSKTSFGQELKKELGICGKTVSAILKSTPQDDADLSDIAVDEAEFCDNGRYELNANFIISFYDAKDKLIYNKKVFLTSLSIQESVDKKKGIFLKTKIAESENSRIVKFPMSKEMGIFTSYKIESLDNSKIYGIKKIKWEIYDKKF